ncbi:MAG TPA: metallophosphoesterase family protein [Candidatus Acidoferrales bacterium]|nr:metallophosphoesterase family protein [Candidatus Acidoferrales bacterium]
MRTAILSDVHGNMAALEAVLADLKLASPDLVLQGGDLAMGGHRPAEVVDRIREMGCPGVVGNTDEVLWNDESRAALERSAPKLGPLLRMIFDDVAATVELLGEERVAWLRTLPGEWRSSDAQIALVHASPGNLWRAPGPEGDEAELVATYGSLGARIAVYGHIHRPYVRSLAALTVANSGSVGAPYDGDPRPSYLLIEGGRATIRRVAYDLERECREFVASGYPHAEWLAEIRRKGAYVPPPPMTPDRG